MFGNNSALYRMRFRLPQLRIPRTLPRILLGLALISALCWNLAYGADIQSVRISIGPTGTRADIQLDTQTAGDYRLLWLSNPDRLAVDFPASRFSPRFARPEGIGVVRAVRHGTPVAGTARVVFDLTGPVTAFAPRTEQGPDGARLVIEWPGDGGSNAGAPPARTNPPPQTYRPAAPTPPPQPPADPAASDSDAMLWPLGDSVENIIIGNQSGQTSPPQEPPPPPHSGQPGGSASTLPAERAGASAPANARATGPPLDPIAQIAAAHQSGAAAPANRSNASNTEPALPGGIRPLVIAIDPGHGGKDPGAIGPGGTYEKHVVLAIARELARQINATAGMRAYLVRNSDVYLELPQRALSARRVRADMFVSIHADAAENRSIHGASVYTLSTRGASSQHARWLADRENSADLIGGVPLEDNNTLSEVLLDLAHSGHMRASQDAAHHVLTGLGGVGHTHKSSVEYANFSVLRNADMPAMLVETGFISNPAEERRLKDPAYQRRLATAILDGINTYFRNQPPPGTLFAARADAERENTRDSSGGGSR